MGRKKSKQKRLKSGYVALREKTNNVPIGVFTYGGKEYPTPNGMPATVVIAGARFEVRYHSAIYFEPKSNARLLGVVLHNHRLIILEPRQSIHDLRQTLYHEIAHVHLSNYPRLGKLTATQVEAVCDWFAESHYDAISCKE